MHIPETPAAVTADWLTEALRAGGTVGDEVTVAEVTCTDIGEGTGIFGQIARLGITYAAGDGPESLIVKLPCLEPQNLVVAQALGLYEREVRFFQEIAPSTEIRIPACHLAHLADDGGAVLLLEDLGEQYDVGDQVVGLSPDQAEQFVDLLAELHATWWESPAVHALEWLPTADAPAILATVPGIYRAGLPVLEAEWADRVPAESIEVARRLDPVFEDIIVRTGTGPVTFAHGDTRADNLFFAKPGSAAAAGDAPIAIIDFQLSLRARGVADIAYMVGNSMEIADASAHWERLLRRWHDRLVELGVQDYSWDDALLHYRESVLFYLCGAMSLIASFDTGNDRGAAMAEAYTTRIFTHCVDIDAASVL